MSASPQGRTWFRLFKAANGRWLMLGSVLVTLTLSLVCAVVLLNAREDATRQADQAASNIAAIVEQDASRNIEVLDRSLQRLRNGEQLPDLRQLSPELRQLVLFDAAASGPYIGFVQALDETGNVIADSATTEVSNQNWSGRDYFLAGRHAADGDLFIGKPFATGPFKTGSIIISRRVSHPDGGFAGVVVGSLQLAYFRDLFSRLDIGPHGTIALLGTDGTILMRQPFNGNDIGRVVPADAPFYAFMRTGRSPIEGVISLDGLTHHFSYRRVGTLPLVVSVGLANEDIFASWWLKTYEILSLVGCLCLLNVILADRLRRQLRRSVTDEAKYRQLTENVSDIVARIDPDGVCSYASSATRRILGVVPEALEGHRFVDSVHADDQAKFELWFVHLRDNGTGLRTRFRMRRPDGTEVLIEAVANRLPNAPTDEQRGYILLSRDITTEHQLEQANQAHARELERRNAELQAMTDKLVAANREQARFVATMSHEVRTPVMGMLGYAELLASDRRLDPEQHELVEKLHDASIYLRDLLNNELEWARLKAGAPIRIGRVDLLELLNKVRASIEPMARAKNLQVKWEVAGDTPREVVTNATCLRQILLILLDNAVKFTSQGGIMLRVNCNNDRLQCRVIDSGAGIPAAKRDRLFRPFERLDAELMGIEGTGLGLADAVRWMDALGGRIGHEDNPDGGSIFWIDLPIAADVPELVRPTEHAVPTGPLRVLLVDDSDTNRDVVTKHLRNAGHAVTVADSGEAAIRDAVAGAFDVILMDIRMPGLNGVETARRIRKLPGPNSRAAIIAVSAQTADENPEAGAIAALDGYVMKPCTQQELLVAIGRAMSARAGASAWPHAVLADLSASLGPERVEAHLHALANHIACLLAKLRDKDDMRAVVALAHRIAGDAGQLGFSALSAAAGTFENAADAQLAAATAALLHAASQAEGTLHQNLSASRNASMASAKLV
jgi:PAS domain S-box-containing protein